MGHTIAHDRLTGTPIHSESQTEAEITSPTRPSDTRMTDFFTQRNTLSLNFRERQTHSVIVRNNHTHSDSDTHTPKLTHPHRPTYTQTTIHTLTQK